MILLVDTNIIIDFWRNPTEKVKDIFKKEDVYICGVVVAELMHGAVSDKDLDIIKNAISPFPRLHMETSDWIGLGELLYKLRKNGVSIPFQDAMISYLAIKNGATVWTQDKHFQLIGTVIQDLMLYEEKDTEQ